MNQILCSIAVTLSLSSPALAGNNISELLSSNQKLQQTFAQMGYQSVSEIAAAFDEAEQKIKAQGVDPNFGTLAICGKLGLDLFVGGNGRLCTTFFHAYSVKSINIGLAIDMSATLNAIYFRSSVPKEHHFCFQGGRLAVGDGPYLGLEGLAETGCELHTTKPKGGYTGLFIGIEAGVGAGFVASGTDVEVTLEETYWN